MSLKKMHLLVGSYRECRSISPLYFSPLLLSCRKNVYKQNFYTLLRFSQIRNFSSFRTAMERKAIKTWWQMLRTRSVIILLCLQSEFILKSYIQMKIKDLVSRNHFILSGFFLVLVYTYFIYIIVMIFSFIFLINFYISFFIINIRVCSINNILEIS